MPRWGFDNIFDLPVDIFVSNGLKEVATELASFHELKLPKNTLAEYFKSESQNQNRIKILRAIGSRTYPSGDFPTNVDPFMNEAETIDEKAMQRRCTIARGVTPQPMKEFIELFVVVWV